MRRSSGMRFGAFDLPPNLLDAVRRTGASVSELDGPVPDNIDCVIVAGGDRGVRRYFHDMDVSPAPVLGISEGETGGFLAQTDIREIAAHLRRIQNSDCSIGEVMRLGVGIDGKRTYPVLNDAAVFSSRSAMLVEYTLSVNGQEVWHDNSDGIIICTPLGSTAYSMSAGGPMIYQGSPVLGVVSVNSLDITRRPLVVPAGSTIEVADISSKMHCEVVLDGTERINVNKGIRLSMLEPPAHIVRMQKDVTSISVLAKKVHLAEDLLSMPPSSKLLLKTLEYEGVMTQRALAAKTMLPDRTVRMALAHLLKKGYVKRRVSVRDGRQRIYEISHIS